MERLFSRPDGFLAARRSSPSGLALVVAMHGAAVAAALLITGSYIVPDEPTTIDIVEIEPDAPPPPLPPPPRPNAELPDIPTQTLSRVPRIDDSPVLDFPDPPIFVDRGPVIPPATPDPPARPRDPVTVNAEFASRASLQPIYPQAMRRAGIEGRVTVRVQIGTDGRVLAIERVEATNDAFFEATRRQALARWRFRPATRDGIPIVSWQTHTVVFQLQNA